MVGLDLKSDEELMILYQVGDTNAFSTLFARFERPVRGYLQSKLFKSELVQDVFQDCFMKLHRSRFLYDSKYPVKAFIFTIARSVLIDHYRKSGNKLANEKQLQLETVNSGEPASTEALDDALSSLAPREQLAITGRFTEDKTFQELAQLLGTSESNIRQIISRSMSKLKKILVRPPSVGGSKP